jgi:hypothetical protein
MKDLSTVFSADNFGKLSFDIFKFSSMVGRGDILPYITLKTFNSLKLNHLYDDRKMS